MIGFLCGVAAAIFTANQGAQAIKHIRDLKKDGVLEGTVEKAKLAVNDVRETAKHAVSDIKTTLQEQKESEAAKAIHAILKDVSPEARESVIEKQPAGVAAKVRQLFSPEVADL